MSQSMQTTQTIEEQLIRAAMAGSFLDKLQQISPLFVPDSRSPDLRELYNPESFAVININPAGETRYQLMTSKQLTEHIIRRLYNLYLADANNFIALLHVIESVCESQTDFTPRRSKMWDIFAYMLKTDCPDALFDQLLSFLSAWKGVQAQDVHFLLECAIENGRHVRRIWAAFSKVARYPKPYVRDYTL